MTEAQEKAREKALEIDFQRDKHQKFRPAFTSVLFNKPGAKEKFAEWRAIDEALWEEFKTYARIAKMDYEDDDMSRESEGLEKIAEKYQW